MADDEKAPIGMQLGVLAASFHWFSAVTLFVGIMTNEGEHSAEWETKSPDRMDQMHTVFNFSHPDSGPMILDRLSRTYDIQGFLVFEGMMESIACVLAICTLMCLKAQMNYRVPADDRKMVMYACMILGLLIPMLEFCLRAGPYSFVGWVGNELEKNYGPAVDDDAFFKNFADVHIQMLGLTLQVVESLFAWVNVVTFINWKSFLFLLFCFFTIG
jgi:hypothetical protein